MDISTLPFLPTWPLPSSSLFLFGLLLFAGLLGGRFASTTRVLPQITGYIAIGFLLGPSVLNVLPQELLLEASVFVDAALGLILFQLGMLLDLRKIREDRPLLWSATAECSLTFLTLFTVLQIFGISPLASALAAAIGVSSSPAVLMLVARELGADGPITRRGMELVAINNVVAFLLFTVLIPVMHFEQRADWTTIAFEPAYRLLGSIAVGYLLARLLVAMGGRLGTSTGSRFALLVAVIAIGVGLSQMLQLSVLLTMLATGVLTRALHHGEEAIEARFGEAGDLFYIILFVVAGAKLQWDALVDTWWVALAFVFFRIVAKLAGILMTARKAGIDDRHALYLGMTLTPMAGLAIGLSQTMSDMYPVASREVTALVLASVALLETVGPILTEYALKRSGEVAADSSVKH